ncbi:MAG: hypothetical protein OT477_16385 [Chloroflexi bacterium]|nr:hypothetical protein [Chloroflexota bacterium]
MTLEWTSEIEERFTELRLREMGGQLTAVEQAELYAQLATVAEESTAPWLSRVEKEQADLENMLSSEQTRNRELMALFNQQALLIADSKRWLAEFEQRYAAVHMQLNAVYGEEDVPTAEEKMILKLALKRHRRMVEGEW